MAAAKPKTAPLIIERTVLAKNLAALTLACDSKNTIPVLSTVLLEAKDGRLHMTATDLDVALECSCDAVAFAPLAVAVNAKLLSAIVAKATEDVQMELDGTRLKVSYAQTEVRLPITEKGHFPNIQRIEAGEIKLSADIVRKLIHQTKYATSKDESRYAIAALLLRSKDGRIEAIGNNGERMTIAGVAVDTEPFDAVIPRKALNVLYAVLEGCETIRFAQNDNLLRFDLDGMVMTARKLTASFPNCDFVLGQLAMTSSVTLKTKTLKDSLARMGDLQDGRTKHVRILIEDGWLNMEYVSAERGQGNTKIAVDYSGESVKFGVDCSYLSDAVRVVEAEEIKLCFSAIDKPITVETEGYRAVIMVINPKLV